MADNYAARVESRNPGPGVTPTGSNPVLASGTLGTSHIVFIVMATVAPAGGAVAILPLALGLGVGIGTPGMYLVIGALMIIFAIAFTKMVPHVQNAGAFFAYIVKGLGRLPGLAGAYVATVSYLCLAAATGGAMGFFANTSVLRFTGIDLPWWVYTLAGLVITYVLSYFKVTLAAGVLGVALVLELIVVVGLDIAIIAQNGFGSLPLESFNPAQVFGFSGAGAVGVAMIFAFSCFQGFEGSAIYTEEARKPEKTIPRATYISIGSIAVFFILTAWALISGAGAENAQELAAADPGIFTFALSDQYIGAWWTAGLEILIVTSCFAGVLAFHNAASRYIFALGRDGFLPRPVSRLHAKHASPYVAGIVSFVLAAGAVSAFAIAGLDPLTNLSAALTGLGAVGLMMLITATAFAVLVYFLKEKKYGWAYTGAPILSTIGFATITFFAFTNYEAITGVDSEFINSLPIVQVVIIIVGIATAWYARNKRPAVYAKMGRTLVD